MKLIKQVVIKQYLSDHDHIIFVVESDKIEPLMTKSLKKLGEYVLSVLDLKSF